MGKVMVPSEVAAAVQTRRVELLSPLRARVSREGLGPEDAVALIDLVRDAIVEAQKDDERCQVLIQRVEGLRGNLKGALVTLDTLVAEFITGSAPEGDEDDHG